MKTKLEGISKLVITDDKFTAYLVTQNGSILAITIEDDPQIEAYINAFVDNILKYFDTMEL